MLTLALDISLITFDHTYALRCSSNADLTLLAGLIALLLKLKEEWNQKLQYDHRNMHDNDIQHPDKAMQCFVPRHHQMPHQVRKSHF